MVPAVMLIIPSVAITMVIAIVSSPVRMMMMKMSVLFFATDCDQ
jgi:hypothetical protein